MMPLKLPLLKLCAGLVHDDGAQAVEQLPRVEAVFTVAADFGNDIVEIVEDDGLLGISPRLLGRCALRTTLPMAVLISRRKGEKSGALPSEMIGMKGVMMFRWISNCASFVVSATMVTVSSSLRPQP